MNASDELANGKEAKQKAKDNLHAYESRVTRLSNAPRRELDGFSFSYGLFVRFENSKNRARVSNNREYLR